MSPAASARDGSSLWRAIQAAFFGVAAGVIGVFISRSLFGPAAAPLGIIVGAGALGIGTFLSWRLNGGRRPADSLGIPRSVRLRRRVHAVAWIAPVAGSIITVAAWTGVAHSSGSGWVQAVGALLAAFLLVGLIAPVWPARRTRLTCTVSPFDARAGQPFGITFEANRPARVRPIYPYGPEQQAGGSQRGSRTVTLQVTPHHRGVLDAVVVEVGSSAPFGLMWWVRDVELPLPHLIHIAPRTGLADGFLASTDDTSGEAATRVNSGIGEPRGIRPYAPGDQRRAVHWPATSHAGVLMVRESERPTDDPVFVEMVLPHDAMAAEAEAERVMAGITDCLARLRPVVLATQEPAGRVVRPVRDRLELGRRLARAVPS